MKEHLRSTLFAASGLIIFLGFLINSFWTILFGCAVFTFAWWMTTPVEVAAPNFEEEPPPPSGEQRRPKSKVPAPLDPDTPKTLKDAKQLPRKEQKKKQNVRDKKRRR